MNFSKPFHGGISFFRPLFLVVSVVGLIGLAGCSGKDTPYKATAEGIYGTEPLACSGITMASTCGNGSCDAVRLETAETCPEDCTDYLTITNNKITICPDVQTYEEPATEAEMRSAVINAVSSGKRIRFTGTHHSINGTFCGDGATISTRKMEQILGVNNGVVTVQAGAKIGDVADYLHDQGLSLGFAHIGWRGITVAGSIGTTAHGSAPKESAILAHRVVSLKVMGPTGDTEVFTAAATPSDKWRALISNLGLLGGIVEVGLQTEPQFNLATTITNLPESDLFAEGGVLGMGEGCDFYQVNWMPSSDTVLKWCGQRKTEAEAPAEEGARNGLLGGSERIISPLTREIFHLGVCEKSVACAMEASSTKRMSFSKPLFKVVNGVSGHTPSAVGHSHRIVSGDYSLGAGVTKFGDPSQTLRTMDWEVAIPQKYIQAALIHFRDVLAAKAEQDEEPYCLPPIGVFLRFGLIEEGGLLSNSGASGEFIAGQTAMYFELPAVHPYGFPEAELAQYEAFYYDMIAYMVTNYGGQLHWGKNPDDLFELQTAQGRYAAELVKFQAVIDEMDPYGVFHNDFGDRIGLSAPLIGQDFATHYFPPAP